MTTEQDVYGMTPWVRAAFENQFTSQPLTAEDGFYDRKYYHEHARTWAACAKLNRERIKELETDLVSVRKYVVDLQNGGALVLARVKELETKVNHSEMPAELKLEVANARREVEQVQAANSTLTDEVEKLEAENARRRADAVRLNWLERAGSTEIYMLHDQPGRGNMDIRSDQGNGQGASLRHAIDAAMKGGA